MLKSFKIKPDPNNKYYFLVNVFEKQKQMLTEIRKKWVHCPAYRAVFDFTCDGEKLAIISFCQDHMNLDTVLHEINHATIQYFRVCQIDFSYKTLNKTIHQNEIPKEELFCYLNSYLMNQVIKKINFPLPPVKRPTRFFNHGKKYYKWHNYLVTEKLNQ